VIFHPSDFTWAEQYAEKMRKGTALYLQPEWDRSADMMPLIVDYVKAHPSWRATLQIHKYLNVP